MLSTRREFCLTAGSGLGLALLAQSRTAEAAAANRFLEGNYEPIGKEITASTLTVDGEIPAELHGLYVRNGANPLYPPTPYHWFDGDGMLHGLYLKDGEAAYANRYVVTDKLRKEQAAKRPLYGGALAGGMVKNVANTAVVWHHGRLLALWEGGDPYEIDAKTLSTRGVNSLGRLRGLPYTAHPKIDPVSGDMVGFGYLPLPLSFIAYCVHDKDGQLRHQAILPLTRPAMMHDFAVTGQHTIFLDLPELITPQGISFDPSLGARLGVMPRRGTARDLRWFPIEPCWIFHVLNAFEEGERLVLLAVRHDRFPDFGPGGTVSTSQHVLYRYDIDLKAGKVTERPIGSEAVEFPVVSPRVVGQPAKYGYLSIDADGEGFTGVQKVDERGKIVATCDYGDQQRGDEALFVPRPSGSEEDDGWLIAFVRHRATRESQAVIVDAREMERGPVARIRLPQRVPFGFHASWAEGVQKARALSDDR